MPTATRLPSQADRVLAKVALYDLHVITEACAALPDDFRARHPEVDWKGWKDFRNLTTHAYWRADATIAAEAMERAIPVWSRVVAVEQPAAARGVGERPDTDEEIQSWWRKQHRQPVDEPCRLRSQDCSAVRCQRRHS